MSTNDRSVLGLLWDLDGVIVDSAEGHFRSWQAVLGQLGIAFPYSEFERFFGMRNEEFLSAYVPALSVEAQRPLIAQKEVLYQRYLRSPKPMRGAATLVEEATRAGVGQAVFSSTLQSNIEAVLDAFALRPHFNAVIGAEQVRVGKPDPEGWLMAAQAVGCLLHQCVVIEDAAPGIQAAIAGGMWAVGLAPSSKRDNVLAEADLLVRTLDDPRLYAFLELGKGE
jgi:beta-phosphoglucomutase